MWNYGIWDALELMVSANRVVRVATATVHDEIDFVAANSKIVPPLGSMAETRPQAPGRISGIVNELRRRFAEFNLLAHFL